eukprot:9131267-Pyramimonas_sp.AAC.1
MFAADCSLLLVASGLRERSTGGFGSVSAERFERVKEHQQIMHALLVFGYGQQLVEGAWLGVPLRRLTTARSQALLIRLPFGVLPSQRERERERDRDRDRAARERERREREREREKRKRLSRSKRSRSVSSSGSSSPESDNENRRKRRRDESGGGAKSERKSERKPRTFDEDPTDATPSKGDGQETLSAEDLEEKRKAEEAEKLEAAAEKRRKRIEAWQEERRKKNEEEERARELEFELEKASRKQWTLDGDDSDDEDEPVQMDDKEAADQGANGEAKGKTEAEDEIDPLDAFMAVNKIKSMDDAEDSGVA